MASQEVQEELPTGPSTGQQQGLQALEAWVASLEEQEVQHQALEAWVASLAVPEERRQALEAWAASLEGQGAHHRVALAALAALAVVREA